LGSKKSWPHRNPLELADYVFCPNKKITSRTIKISSILTVIFIWTRRTKLLSISLPEVTLSFWSHRTKMMVLEKGFYSGYPATKVLNG
jgi:hypothetical protein